jgi:Flp pilus assembly protein TadB
MHMPGDDDGDDAEKRRMDAMMTALQHRQQTMRTRRKRIGVFYLLSFLLFCAVTVIAVSSFPRVYWLFAAILAIDGAATVFDLGQVVAATRSFFFLATVVASIALFPYDLPLLVFEVLILILLIDASFFLRRLEGTRVDRSALTAKLRSYVFIFVPALLISYVSVYLYYLVPRLAYSQSLVLLGGASIGAFIVLYLLMRYLSPPSHLMDERY